MYLFLSRYRNFILSENLGNLLLNSSHTFVSLIAGCENGCSGHGQCTLEEGLYKCVCIQGWAGTDCSIPLEQECHDDVDNDHGKITHFLKFLFINNLFSYIEVNIVDVNTLLHYLRNKMNVNLPNK